jgi:hypothetical protein
VEIRDVLIADEQDAACTCATNDALVTSEPTPTTKADIRDGNTQFTADFGRNPPNEELSRRPFSSLERRT